MANMRNWATDIVARLAAGETIEITASGNSMRPILVPGQLFTLEPLQLFIQKNAWAEIATNDARPYPLAHRIVLVTVQNGSTFLHRIQDVVFTGSRRWYLIANCGGTHGIKTNGWVTEDQIHGVLVGVKDAPAPSPSPT